MQEREPSVALDHRWEQHFVDTIRVRLLLILCTVTVSKGLSIFENINPSPTRFAYMIGITCKVHFWSNKYQYLNLVLLLWKIYKPQYIFLNSKYYTLFRLLSCVISNCQRGPHLFWYLYHDSFQLAEMHVSSDTKQKKETHLF